MKKQISHSVMVLALSFGIAAGVTVGSTIPKVWAVGAAKTHKKELKSKIKNKPKATSEAKTKSKPETKSAAKAESKSDEPANSEPTKAAISASEVFAKAAGEFRSSPDDATWAEVEKTFKALLMVPVINKLDSATVIKNNPILTDLGVQVIEPGTARLWLFPKIAQSQSVIISWHDIKASPKKRKHASPPEYVAKVQFIAVPQTVQFKEARIIDIHGLTAAAETVDTKKSSAKSPAKSSRKAPVKPVSHLAKSGSHYFLVMIGREKSTNTPWLKSYRLNPDGWHENLEPLSSIPPFFLTNVSGKITFNGNDLVLVMNPEIVTYKLMLRLVEGRYALEGKPTENTAYNACYQFVHAVLQGKNDLAKAWLMDPKLISIPKYLGLSTKTFPCSPRVISMSSPTAGIFRYRLVTFDKDDLIIDVAKSKTQWAVKAVFIAPSDLIMQKIAKSVPAMDKFDGKVPEEPLAKTTIQTTIKTTETEK